MIKSVVLTICALLCMPRFPYAFQFSTTSLENWNVLSASNQFKPRNVRHGTHFHSSLPPTEPQEQTYDVISPSHPLSPVIQATMAACEPRRLDTTADKHEAFRYEWGTWCGDDKLDAVMEILGDVRLREGWEDVIGSDVKTEASFVEESAGTRDGGRRLRVAGGKYWDIILHILPKNA